MPVVRRRRYLPCMDSKNLPRRKGEDGFSAADREAWARLAADQTDDEVAALAGVAKRTIIRWRQCHSILKSEVTRRGRRDIATDEEKRELALACQERQERVMEVLDAGLEGRLDPETEGQQLRAADVLLNRGWGTAWRGEPPRVLVARDKVEAFVEGILGEG